MSKLIKLFIILFVLYILFEIAFNFFSKGYETKYKIDDFKVTEKRVKMINNEMDNYYFEIEKNDKVFSIQTFKKISNSQKVIKEIKSFKDEKYECILPIMKDDIVVSDIICENNNIYYYYNTLKGTDSNLDSFANTLASYRKNFEESDKVIKSDININAYDNFEDEIFLGIEYYKGLYIIDKRDGYRKNQLFEKDVYTKDLSVFINGNYVVADYNQKYEFHDFKIINLKTYKESTITSDKMISMYSYIQGIVDNSFYIIDTSNKLQYEVDMKTKTVTIIGNEKNGIKVYKNGRWEKGSMYDAIKDKVLFKESNRIFNDVEYARVDKAGNELSGYYYVYKKNNDNYDAYRINVQDDSKWLYLFSTDNIDEVLYDKDYVFYKDGTFIKYYSDLTGSKKLAEYDEVSFNKSLKFSFSR